MDYRKIITLAWQNTWKNRWMWLLGMAIISSSGSFYTRFPGAAIDGLDSSDISGTQSEVLIETLTNYWFLFVLLIVCLVLFIIVAYIFHYIAISGMQQGAAWAVQGQPVKFWAMCKVGTQHFWRVLFMSILLRLLVIVPLMCLLVIIIVFAITIIGLILAIPLAIALLMCSLPIAWASTVVYRFALQGIVFEQHGIWQSIKIAWARFQAFWSDTLVAYIVSIVWTIIISLVTFILVIIIAAPLAILAYFTYTTEAWLALGLIIGSGLILVGVISFIIKGISQSFISHLWYGFYLAALAQR
ncbi:MAG: hypothetical protein WCV88_05835 [Patescibacteria group bacterium]